jgi:hypothetical protein
MKGTRRMVITSGRFDAGVHHGLIESGALESGSYIVRLAATGAATGERVAKSKEFRIVK